MTNNNDVNRQNFQNFELRLQKRNVANNKAKVAFVESSVVALKNGFVAVA